LEQLAKERQALQAEVARLRDELRRAGQQRKAEQEAVRAAEQARREADEARARRAEQERDRAGTTPGAGGAGQAGDLREALEEIEALRQKTQIEYKAQLDELRVRQAFVEARMRLDLDYLDRKKAAIVAQLKGERPPTGTPPVVPGDRLDAILQRLDRLERRLDGLDKARQPAERKERGRTP
jgi:hypothetical protein